jgi:hypothetical protein
MKRNSYLCLLVIITVIASCKKDDAKTSSASIEGTYSFKGLTAKTNSTITGDDGEKVVTVTNYSTTNNMGTVVFDNSKVTNTGLSYSVNSIATGYFYEDNVLIDSTSYPFTVSIPATNSVSSYQLIGADSIYFPNGSISSGLAGGESIPSGGRYTIAGNLLTISMRVAKDSAFTDSGIEFQMVESAITSIELEKQ